MKQDEDFIGNDVVQLKKIINIPIKMVVYQRIFNCIFNRNSFFFFKDAIVWFREFYDGYQH